MASYAQLLQQREEIDRKIELARKKEADGVIKRMKEAIAVYGLTAADIFGPEKPARKKPGPKPKIKVSAPTRAKAPKPKAAKKKASPLKGVKKPVKYSDGNGNSWSGGGNMPNWLKAKIDEGHSIDEFLVKKAA